MRYALDFFWADTKGSVSLDWVILTAVLVGTGLAVTSTVSEGLSSVSGGVSVDLQDASVSSSFDPRGGTLGRRICAGGVEAAQKAEDARVAAGGSNAIVVSELIERELQNLSDDELRARLARARGGATNGSRAATLSAAAECEMVARGLG